MLHTHRFKSNLYWCLNKQNWKTSCATSRRLTKTFPQMGWESAVSHLCKQIQKIKNMRQWLHFSSEIFTIIDSGSKRGKDCNFWTYLKEIKYQFQIIRLHGLYGVLYPAVWLQGIATVRLGVPTFVVVVTDDGELHRVCHLLRDSGGSLLLALLIIILLQAFQGQLYSTQPETQNKWLSHCSAFGRVKIWEEAWAEAQTIQEFSAPPLTE